MSDDINWKDGPSEEVFDWMEESQDDSPSAKACEYELEQAWQICAEEAGDKYQEILADPLARDVFRNGFCSGLLFGLAVTQTGKTEVNTRPHAN